MSIFSRNRKKQQSRQPVLADQIQTLLEQTLPEGITDMPASPLAPLFFPSHAQLFSVSNRPQKPLGHYLPVQQCSTQIIPTLKHMKVYSFDFDGNLIKTPAMDSDTANYYFPVLAEHKNPPAIPGIPLSLLQYQYIVPASSHNYTDIACKVSNGKLLTKFMHLSWEEDEHVTLNNGTGPALTKKAAQLLLHVQTTVLTNNELITQPESSDTLTVALLDTLQTFFKELHINALLIQQYQHLKEVNKQAGQYADTTLLDSVVARLKESEQWMKDFEPQLHAAVGSYVQYVLYAHDQQQAVEAASTLDRSLREQTLSTINTPTPADLDSVLPPPPTAQVSVSATVTLVTESGEEVAVQLSAPTPDQLSQSVALLVKQHNATVSKTILKEPASSRTVKKSVSR